MASLRLVATTCRTESARSWHNSTPSRPARNLKGHTSRSRMLLPNPAGSKISTDNTSTKMEIRSGTTAWRQGCPLQWGYMLAKHATAASTSWEMVRVTAVASAGVCKSNNTPSQTGVGPTDPCCQCAAAASLNL